MEHAAEAGVSMEPAARFQMPEQPDRVGDAIYAGDACESGRDVRRGPGTRIRRSGVGDCEPILKAHRFILGRAVLVVGSHAI
jgi:hypothetical protein